MSGTFWTDFEDGNCAVCGILIRIRKPVPGRPLCWFCDRKENPTEETPHFYLPYDHLERSKPDDPCVHCGVTLEAHGA